MKKHKQLTLMQIFKSSPKQLLNHFAALHPKSITGEDFTFVPGDVRMPLLVAHADIVHRALPEMILLDEVKRVMSSPTGIGADDRAGVHAILTLWENLSPKPGLLLCDKEETGGIGAVNASYDIYDQLQTYPFYVEIDRKGSGECVFYNHEHEEFINYIESFGFKEEYGMFSDVSTLGSATRKCSVNLSAGYANAHTINEYLMLNALEYTIRRTKKLMLSMLHSPPKKLSFRLPRPPKIDRLEGYGSYGGGYTNFYGTDTDTDLPAVDDYMKDDSKFNWDSRGKYGKPCDMCGCDSEVRYTNLTYGYLCNECYEAWFEEDERMKGGLKK